MTGAGQAPSVSSLDPRIYWRCRRGMRELEELLLDFVRVHYASLSQPDKRAFEQLLDYPDQVLLEYTMGEVIPRDRTLAQLLARIRRAAAP